MYCALKDLLGDRVVYAYISYTTDYCWIGTEMNNRFETDFTFNRYELMYELDQNEWENLHNIRLMGF